MTNLTRSLVLGCSVLALAACGPEDLGSPGANGDINIDITNPAPSPTPTPTPGPGGGVTPAADCPTIGTDTLSNNGTISGPTGEYRVCGLPTSFTDDARLPYVEGVLYSLPGRVDVGSDDGPTDDDTDGIEGTTVELTIDPGVIVYGATGRSYMVVQRGSSLNAEGTEDRPIVFTSRDNVLGLTNNTSSQQWGGVVLLGRAAVSDCTAGANPANQIDCQQELEGALNPPSFGGDTGDDSSGSLAYVQIRYSGFTLAEGSELQSLTAGGVGSGTGISYIQSFNSSDDGVELFGGEPKMDHFIVVGAEDDSFDIDTGAKADIQYGLVVQRDGAGDRALELDSPDNDFTIDALPRTNAQFNNFTFWAAGGGDQAVAIRGAADLTMTNGVIVKPNGNCVSVNDDETAAGRSQDDEAGEPMFNSVGFQCSDDDTGDVPGYISAGTGNTTDYTNTLTGKYLNGASEMDYDPIFDGTQLSSFFDDPQPGYIGAVPNDDDWTQGWTCDSDTVSFGSNSSCFSLPVYN